jgi:glycosyltransferase involved in cell wall biosynthesis
MTQSKILCSISTKNRYDTFLPLAIQSVINQTRLPDKLVIFDDNDNPRDTREDPKYHYLFSLLDKKNIEWEVVFALKKGQHYNHQIANKMGYDWVWRVDDDNSPEQNVLENLSSYIADNVGAIGGSVLTPDWGTNPINATGKIQNINDEPNMQWGIINEVKEVDHLHCSFLYRAGIVDYNLGLSKVAHREETLFTYQLKQKGYKNLIIPNTITWHAKSSTGGIRSENIKELYDHDEQIFRNIVELEDKSIVILDCGMGDHIVFKRILPDIKNPVIFSCYPEIVPGRSIAEAEMLYGDISYYNIYKKMDEWDWKDSLENAFRKLYGVDA